MVDNYRINEYEDEVQVYVYDDEEKQALINKVNRIGNLRIAELRPSGLNSIIFNKERNYDSFKVKIEYKKDYFLRLIAEGYNPSVVNKLVAATKSISLIDEIALEDPVLNYMPTKRNDKIYTSVEINIYKEKKKA